MTDIEQFFADNLPPHMQPSNPTEKLLMSYAWYEGHAQGLKTGLSYANQSLLRLVPKHEDAAWPTLPSSCSAGLSACACCISCD